VTVSPGAEGYVVVKKEEGLWVLEGGTGEDE